MLTFFRRIRIGLLGSGHTRKYVLYAIGEIALVVIGILIALQINTWNENRKKRIQEKFILERLLVDIHSDLDLVSYQIDKANSFLDQFMFCMDVILGVREASREEFVEQLRPILTILYFNQNRTSFDHIVSSGQIEYIRNPVLTDSIIQYYNDGGNIGWDSGLREFTRNIIAPYMMNLDHIPQPPQTSYREQANRQFTKIDVSKSRIKARSLEDYKNDIYFINILRNKIYMIEGQLMEYEHLKSTMQRLQIQITQNFENRNYSAK